MEAQFQNLTDAQIVREAKSLQAEAVKIESKADSLKADASEKKWGVADRCLALNQRGWSQTKIAKAISMNQSTVSRYLKMVAMYAVPHTRPTFGEAYAEVEPSASTIETYKRHTRALAERDPDTAASLVADAAPKAVAKTARRRSVSKAIAKDKEALGRVTDAALRGDRDEVPGAQGVQEARRALDDMTDPASEMRPHIEAIERILDERVEPWLARYAGVVWEQVSEDEPERDGPNLILMDTLAEFRVRLNFAFQKHGVGGQSIQEGLDELLGNKKGD